MTDVDFYILSAQHPEERMSFACRLAEKAYRSQCNVCIHVDSPSAAETLDEYLWSYREESFLPHAQVDKGDEETPVLISYGSQEPPCYDVLINLADEIPSGFTRYKRVLEVVIQQDDVLASTRKHYRYYKDRGYPMNNIDMRISE